MGKPGVVKETIAKGGYRRSTKIGEDGRATKERHWTDHNRAHTGHTDPHDHDINWDSDRGNPQPGPPINYPDGDVPEFKSFKEKHFMTKSINDSSIEENRFKTISEFKWCINDGGEIEFKYNGRSYSITHPNNKIDIGEGYYIKDGIAYNVANHQECVDMIGKQYNTADEVLEYMIDGIRLRDIITQVEIIDRTI